MGADFLRFSLDAGLKGTWPGDRGPIEVLMWRQGACEVPEGASGYALVRSGEVVVDAAGLSARVGPGGWLSLPGPMRLSPTGADPSGLLILAHGDAALLSLGGAPVGPGRLDYVDGCTDTLLAGPVRLGDPCLNHLHLPPGTRQRTHTHPSIRVGVVLAGVGRCVTEQGEHLLEPGVAWCIPAHCRHAFYTDDSAVDILAWHPDSDFGPTDTDHPMVNRTILQASGQSASGASSNN